MNTLLDMTGITKEFSRVRVLDDVFFQLNRGEVHVLAGENGAGKSTLMKILSGVYGDYTGEIVLDGKPARFSSPHDAAWQGIAMIHQELSLIDSMSVVDNVFLGREHTCGGMWLDRKRQEAKTHEVLARLGLEIDVRRLAGEYSLSIRQMIEIARALTFDARILIMDEPTSSLNHPEVAQLFSLIEGLKQECGIIYITHKMEEIYRLADRITVLRDGRHVCTAAAGNLPRQELVKKLVGRNVSEQYPVRNTWSGRTVLDVQNFSITGRTGSTRTPVRDVSFSVKAGEILGFAGLQGSGNSELFHGLFGSYGRCATGRILVDGEAYHPRSPAHAKHVGLALLTNDRKGNGLVQEMSVMENISLASINKISGGGWMRESLEKGMAELHRKRLHIRMVSENQGINELSGGNQQKVVLAKWLETGPKILLLDEPTRGVDIGAKHEIYEAMNRWSAEGMAMLLITSELSELLALSDRIIVMHRGRINASYARDEATRENIIQAAM